MKINFTNPANMQRSAQFASTGKFKDVWNATQKTDDQGYWLNGKGEPVEHRTREGEIMRTKVADNGLISHEYTNASGETREESTPRNNNSWWRKA